VAEIEDVRLIALALPETSEQTSRDGNAHWRVRDKLFVWERPLRRPDLLALGDVAQDGVIVGARVADEGVKAALVSATPSVSFTTPHFDGYPAILVRLSAIAVAELEELIVDAWLDRAPVKLAKAYLDGAT
jgi:hypothetical protein